MKRLNYCVVVLMPLLTASVMGQGSPVWIMEELGHSNSVTAEVFSPDGLHYVTGSSDQQILIRVATTGQEVKRLKGHSGVINSLTYSPDGEVIVSASSDKTIRFWNATTGLEIGMITEHSAEVTSVEFSPDGKQLVSGSVDGTVRLWNPDNRQEISQFNGHSQPVTSVSFHKDGNLLASGSADRTIRLWNISTGAEERILNGHTDVVTSVAFSPSSTLPIIASGSSDRTIRLWNISTGLEILEEPISFHEGRVNDISFSSDGKWMVSVSENRIFMLTEFALFGRIRFLRVTLSQNIYPLQSVSLSPDGKFVSFGSGIETSNGRRLGLSFISDFARYVSDRATISTELYLAPTWLTYSVAFSPDGSQFASGSWDGTLRFTSIQGDVVRRFPTGDLSAIYSLAISPDGTHLVSGSSDPENSLRIWNTNSSSVIDSLSEESQTVTAVTFSTHGNQFVAGSRDGRVQLWDLESREVKATLSGHLAQINSVAFSPDDGLLASASDDQTVHLWDLQNQTLLRTFSDLSGSINSVVFSPTDNLIVAGSSDGRIRVWDTSTGQLVRQITGHFGQVSSVDISPDRNHIVSGSYDGSVRVWNLSTGEETRRFEHEAAVLSVDISSNGQYIVSAGENSVRLWDQNNLLEFASTIENQTYIMGRTITPLILPEVIGGVTPVRYTLEPQLPDGLNFNASSRQLTGTPQSISSPQSFTYSATDSRGFSGQLTFTIDVTAPVATERQELPEVFTMVGNYPNPFQESTHLLFDLPWSAMIHVEVMDVIGRRILTIPPRNHQGGWNRSITIDGKSLPAGVYLYRLTANSDSRTSVLTGQIVRIQ